jgi:hypothetical protein
MSDIATQRLPRGPMEAMAGVTQLRAWGMNRGAAMPAAEIAQAARAAGLVDVEVSACGDRVVGPALRLTKARLRRTADAPFGHRAAARAMLAQVDLMWKRGMIEYVLLRAVGPDTEGAPPRHGQTLKANPRAGRAQLTLGVPQL